MTDAFNVLIQITFRLKRKNCFIQQFLFLLPVSPYSSRTLGKHDGTKLLSCSYCILPALAQKLYNEFFFCLFLS
jgi:hypothetical protein